MFSYLVYGLRINSELYLPELIPSEGKADVTIRLGNLDPPLLKATSTECYCHTTAEEAYLFWEEGGTVLVRGGREIIVAPIPGVEEQVLRLYLLGAAFGILLHQRGLMVLHASAVAVNGSAIAFIGDSGWGKSTTAGALYARGHSVMTDDVTALDLNSTSSPTVLPGFPQLKLWPEAAETLGNAPETSHQLHPELEKRAHITDRFSHTPLPLKCIYVLDDGPVLEIKPLQGQEALAALMRNWYCARFGPQLLQATGVLSHFLKCTDLVNRVTVCCLKRQNSLSALSDIAQLVEEHLDYDIQPTIL